MKASLLLALLCSTAMPVLGDDAPAFAELYSQDFDSGDGGLSVGGVTPSWTHGTPLNGPLSAHSGLHCWATSLSGDYTNNEDGYITSGAIDLSTNSGGPMIFSWWQHLKTEARFDRASLETSVNGGATWQRAYGEVSGPVATAWTREFIILDPSAAVVNFRYRFRLRSDASGTAPGFYVDTIKIRSFSINQVFFENFEADDGGFIPEGVLSTWDHGVPTEGPGSAFSGTKAWGTSLDGYYFSSEMSALVSPEIDLSAHTGNAFLLSWFQHLATEDLADFASVEARPNDSTPWTTLVSPLSGVVSDSWARQSVLLGPEMATTTFQLRFTLTADPFFENSGFYVDDVKIQTITGAIVPTITWADPASIGSQTPLDVTQLNATSSALGSFTYSPNFGDTMPVGNGQSLTATFTPDDLLAYSSVITTVSIDIAVAASYESWVTFPTETLRGDDYDHDGHSNFWEYGFVTDATSATLLGLPRLIVIDDGGTDYPGMEFYVRSDNALLNYAFQTSQTATSWITSALTFDGAVWSLAAGDAQLFASVLDSPDIWRIQIRDTQALGSRGKFFMRVSVNED